MPAYVIFICKKMKSKEHFDQYNRLARRASKGYEIQPLAFYGQAVALEHVETEGVAILQFPDLVQAQAWYDSEAYQEAKKLRDLAGDYMVMITEGLNLAA